MCDHIVELFDDGSIRLSSRRQLLGWATFACDRDFAVIGCGAIGLTTAITFQRAGAHVTIYAKDLPPRSTYSTGIRHTYETSQTFLGVAAQCRILWGDRTEYTGLALRDGEHATPDFKAQWALMARDSDQPHLT